MRELIDQQGLSSPVLQSDRVGNSFKVMLLFHDFLSKDDLAWLKSFAQSNLTEDEMKAMISAREVGAIDNSSYRTINRETDALAASQHLRKLCDCGRRVTSRNALQLRAKKGRRSTNPGLTYKAVTPADRGSTFDSD